MLKEIWQREFSRNAIHARVQRKAAVAEIKYLLDHWADYGDPTEAEQAIAIIRGAM